MTRRFIVSLLILATGLSVAGCGDKGNQISDPAAPPEVISTHPKDNNADVSVSVDITATFNQPMEESSLNLSTFILHTEEDTLSGSLSTTDTSATFTPKDELRYGVSYTASLSPDVKDAAGNTLSGGYQWSFTTSSTDTSYTPPEQDQLISFRIRSSPAVPLNSNDGWAGLLNENVEVNTDYPFRIRFEMEGGATDNGQRDYRLQYRRNGGSWSEMEVSDFPKPEESSPLISIVSASSYEHESQTSNLLSGSGAPFTPGGGISLSDTTPWWTGEESHTEWEWPLVIRRYADGLLTNEEGDTYEFRMAHSDGRQVKGEVTPEVTVTSPPGHVGGTFVETPGRIGPFEASNGDLYFIMEPAETDDTMMMVKSTNGGASWQEVDGSNRPSAPDLESVSAVKHENTIHMLHQNAYDVWYHSLHMSDHPTRPDSWGIHDENIADPVEPPTQVTSIAARSDGSLVGIYGSLEKIRYKTRSPEGAWSSETVVDSNRPPDLSGPQVVAGTDDVIHLAYTGSDGTAWYRRIEPDGSLTSRIEISDRLGTSETDAGSILPLIFIPESNTVVIIYRRANGELWERRVTENGTPTDPVRVTSRSVVQSAVDSDQTGADAIADGSSIYLLFIEEESGDIYHTRSNGQGSWRTPSLEMDEGNAQGIRGNHLSKGSAPDVYGYIYDAGSNGGSGMNRYGELELSNH